MTIRSGHVVTPISSAVGLGDMSVCAVAAICAVAAGAGDEQLAALERNWRDATPEDRKATIELLNIFAAEGSTPAADGELARRACELLVWLPS